MALAAESPRAVLAWAVVLAAELPPAVLALPTQVARLLTESEPEGVRLADSPARPARMAEPMAEIRRAHAVA
jgi:hypothetical protein